ncbi:MAG: PKD domain-containing protein, partial [Syntrophales bacterium]|nr:PKD domain-containing protein [Syntrophales bacterium]
MPAVTLSSATAAKPTFTAPDVGVAGAALTFQLTVTDSGGLQNSDTSIVNVSWVNVAPHADAGPDQTVDEGRTATLDASGSTDPDDGITSYLWTQTAGSSVTLSSSNTIKPTFIAPGISAAGTTLTFQVRVTDQGGLQNTDTVTITVRDNGITDFDAKPGSIPFKTSNNKSSAIKINSGGNLTSLQVVDPSTIANNTNKPASLPYGLFDIKIKVDSIGGTAKV